jgi:hypothetical protein
MPKFKSRKQVPLAVPDMTLRDHFAGCVLRAIASGYTAEALIERGGRYYAGIARAAYELADAMLVQRQSPGEVE